MLRFALAGILALAALGKVLSLFFGYALTLGPVWTALIAVAEAALAWLLLIRRFERACLAVAMLIAVGGVLQAALTEAPCQCFGMLGQMSWRVHLGVSSLFGVLALLLFPFKSHSSQSVRQRGTS